MTPSESAEVRQALLVLGRIWRLRSLHEASLTRLRRALKAVAPAETGRKYRRVVCVICEAEGHCARTCPGRRDRSLYRCQCGVLVFGDERNIHLHDRHGLTVEVDQLGVYYEMAKAEILDDEGNEAE